MISYFSKFDIPSLIFVKILFLVSANRSPRLLIKFFFEISALLALAFHFYYFLFRFV